MKGWMLIGASLVLTWWLYLQAKAIMPAGDWSQAIVQLTGLIGTVTLSWSFLLTTRQHIWEKLFGGLDRTYKAHHILGGIAFILLLQHPLAMIIGSLPHNALALYLVPFQTGWDYTMGQLALYVMLLLLVLTLYIPLSYRLWKWTHEWMGSVILLGGIHSLLIVSDVSRYLPLRLYILGFTLLGLMAAVYKRFLYYAHQRHVQAVVQRVGTAGELIMVSLSYERESLPFGPGQYGFFAFPDTPRDEHPFSILGSDTKTLIIGVKRQGPFTRRLAKLIAGAELIVRGPFGTFAEEMATCRHAVWIAGGIGITPFLSMARALRPSARVAMYFCARAMPDPILTEPFAKVARERPEQFSWKPCVTATHGHLKAETILQETVATPATRYFLCGPQAMMEGITADLVAHGVKRKCIIYEDFAFR
jgi:predicted ferric reductase